MRTRVKRRPAGNPSPGRRIFRVWRAGLKTCVSACEFPAWTSMRACRRSSFLRGFDRRWQRIDGLLSRRNAALCPAEGRARFDIRPTGFHPPDRHGPGRNVRRPKPWTGRMPPCRPYPSGACRSRKAA
ncbi:hypothetical protein C7S14_3335 [Burkholderia cepacia]|nr:hypothetical protein C7S14_3335 [Burkholderia cepacia]